MLEIRLLGTFDIQRDGKTVMVPSRPAQGLFAYLVLTVGTTHRREKLAGMLWPDSTEQGARDYLRHALWKIRKAIEPAKSKSKSDPYIIADDIHISFNLDSKFSLDVKTIKDVNENSSIKELMSALSLYEGELLPGFYDDWVLLEREHLQADYEQKMARLLALFQDEGRWKEVLEWGERWIKLGQKPEPAYRALMNAHAKKGDISKVAAVYERCVKSLKEFGVEPSEQTKELYENLKSGKETPKTVSVTTKPLVKEVSSNIPVSLTSFIGREKELKEIARLLSSSRLLTLTGSGGVGKTRLAIQTANDSIRKFKDGVAWVGLVGLSDGNLIPQEIAQSLNVRDVSNVLLMETLKTHLKPRDILLVIDNCEHLIRDCAQYAEQLLVACPKLKILATSIEALGLFNETTWQVPSLPLPEVQQHSLKELQEFASIELFDARASSAKSGFALDEGNASSVAQICRRLDGIPLAIELAAARIKMLSVEEISGRLDDRFSLLTSGSRTAIPRHQTLRATIDWSYDLLTEPERILLRRLSVFAGGFTLEAAEAVCSQGMKRSDILDLLGRLVDKSLVIVDEISKVSGTRYRLLETIRQYSLEKLVAEGEAKEMRIQHLKFFVSLVEEIEPKLEHIQQQLWLDKLELEIDNLRAGLDWAVENREIATALRLVSALRRFWFIRNHHSEGTERLKAILERPDAAEPTLARLKALNSYLFMLWPSDQLAEVRLVGEEALALGRKLGNRWNIAYALLWLGVGVTSQGDYPLARSYLEQSLEMWQELQDEAYLGWSLVFLGEVALLQGDHPRARDLFEEAIPPLSEAADYPTLAIPLRRLGQLAMFQGDLLKAAALIKESLQYNWAIHDYRGTGASLAALGALSMAQGQIERATELFGVVEGVLEFIRTSILPFDQQQYIENMKQLRSKLAEKTFTKFLGKGKAMLLEDAVAFALEEV